MDYGTLRVATPDGQIREYPITGATVIIGRADGNQVVIDHVSVSRRHAQLVIEADRVTIEDLGSGTGTFVGSQRIPGNTPSPVEGAQTMRFGDVEARFLAAGAAGGPALSATGDVAEVEQTIGVALTSPSQPIAAGSPTTATVNVQNRGTTADELTIAIVDLPAGWAKVSRPTLTLMPGARDEITVVIQTPKDSSAAAGDYEFSVAVTSKVNGREVRALGKVSVRAFEGFRVAIDPPRGKGAFSVITTNNGNVPISVALSGQDEARDLVYAFEGDQFELAAGEEKRTPVVVKAKSRKLFGPTINRNFRIDAQQVGAKASSTADGLLTVKPPLEPYKIPVLAILVLAVLGGAIFGIMQVLGGGGDDKADPDPSPTVAASPAASAVATATPTGLRVGGNGIIANSDPVPTNTNCLAVRSAATRTGDNIVGRLCTGEKVAIKGGPTNADGFVWWQIQSTGGISGWAAEKSADGATPFIQPAP